MTDDELNVRPTPYLRKAYEVEVMRFDGSAESAAEIVLWVTAVHNEQARLVRDRYGQRIVITDDYGQHEADPGDYIIKEDRGFSVQPYEQFHELYKSNLKGQRS